MKTSTSATALMKTRPESLDPSTFMSGGRNATPGLEKRLS